MGRLQIQEALGEIQPVTAWNRRGESRMKAPIGKRREEALSAAPPGSVGEEGREYEEEEQD